MLEKRHKHVTQTFSGLNLNTINASASGLWQIKTAHKNLGCASVFMTVFICHKPSAFAFIVYLNSIDVYVNFISCIFFFFFGFELILTAMFFFSLCVQTEVFNLLYVAKKESEHIVFCESCARQSDSKLESYAVLQQVCAELVVYYYCGCLESFSFSLYSPPPPPLSLIIYLHTCPDFFFFFLQFDTDDLQAVLDRFALHPGASKPSLVSYICALDSPITYTCIDIVWASPGVGNLWLNVRFLIPKGKQFNCVLPLSYFLAQMISFLLF